VNTYRARIIRNLEDGPETIAQLAADLDLSATVVGDELRRMNEALIVRPTNRGWQLRTTYQLATRTKETTP
jgi:DNA-binding HxlR family transcriptional regulator